MGYILHHEPLKSPHAFCTVLIGAAISTWISWGCWEFCLEKLQH